MDFLPKMRAYFAAEKSESLLFILIGIVTLTTAAFCWLVWKRPFYLGMAWPMAAAALIQLVVGSTVYFRTDKNVAYFTMRFETNRAEYVKQARAKMKAVLRNFVVYRWTEICLVVVGLVLILWHAKADFWKGWGAGMFLQGWLMLIADYFAEKRAHEYMALLESLD